MTELRDLLQELRRLKFWLIVAALMCAGLVGFSISLQRSVDRLASAVDRQIFLSAQVKAAYEEQKKDLFKVDGRITEVEIQRRVEAVLKKEQDHE